MSESAGLEATVTHKIGPMPGWAWVVIVAGVAWVYYLWRKKGTVSPSGAVQQTANTSSTTNGVGWGGDGTIPTLSAPGTVVTSNGTPGSTTNAQWSRNVVNSLIAGGADPALANNALTTYLSGGTLSTAQQSIVDTALTKYGAPPEGLIPMNNAPAAPVTPDYTGHLYTVQQGDTFEGILNKFYGESNPVTARLVATNNGLGWLGGTPTNFQIKPGQQIHLDPNGIYGYQPNTLNTYDPGHTLSNPDGIVKPS
jgi:phage tail protein X